MAADDREAILSPWQSRTRQEEGTVRSNTSTLCCRCQSEEGPSRRRKTMAHGSSHPPTQRTPRVLSTQPRGQPSAELRERGRLRLLVYRRLRCGEDYLGRHVALPPCFRTCLSACRHRESSGTRRARWLSG